MHLPIQFGHVKLGLAWSWYATYFLFPLIHWHPLPFTSPEPKLLQIFERQKLISKARNADVSAHPTQSFSLLPPEMSQGL